MTLKLNYYTFGGPFIGEHRRMHDVVCEVPEEYRVSVLSKKPDPTNQLNFLKPFKPRQYSDDLLFHLFYNVCSEVYQLLVAAELFERGWRYHKGEQVWLTRTKSAIYKQTMTHELAVYTVFDPIIWRVVNREMMIHFLEIEGKPDVPDLNGMVKI
uniref:NOT2_3_5 domain-containing protein n=1 Tax=Steinernema glaseri TaxID=37863 RepID=A0A1I7ZSU5_9BILA